QRARITDRLDDVRRLHGTTVDPDAVVPVDDVRVPDDTRRTVDHDRLRTGVAQFLDRIQQRTRVDSAIGIGDLDRDAGPGLADRPRQDRQGIGALTGGLRRRVTAFVAVQQ